MSLSVQKQGEEEGSALKCEQNNKLKNKRDMDFFVQYFDNAVQCNLKSEF